MAEDPSSKMLITRGGSFVEGRQLPRAWIQSIGELFDVPITGYTMTLKVASEYARMDISIPTIPTFTVYVPREEIITAFNPDNPQPVP